MPYNVENLSPFPNPIRFTVAAIHYSERKIHIPIDCDHHYCHTRYTVSCRFCQLCKRQIPDWISLRRRLDSNVSVPSGRWRTIRSDYVRSSVTEALMDFHFITDRIREKPLHLLLRTTTDLGGVAAVHNDQHNWSLIIHHAAFSLWGVVVA